KCLAPRHFDPDPDFRQLRQSVVGLAKTWRAIDFHSLAPSTTECITPSAALLKVSVIAPAASTRPARTRCMSPAKLPSASRAPFDITVHDARFCVSYA